MKRKKRDLSKLSNKELKELAKKLKERNLKLKKEKGLE